MNGTEIGTTFWAPLIAVVVGGLITFIVSWFFYIRAGRKLVQEAEKLRKETLNVCAKIDAVRFVVQPGAEELKVDEEGNTSLVIALKA